MSEQREPREQCLECKANTVNTTIFRHVEKFYEAINNEPKSQQQMLLKLMEETGELARAQLHLDGTMNYRQDNQDFHEELIDVLLVVLGLVEVSGMTHAKFDALMDEKLDKWVGVNQ